MGCLCLVRFMIVDAKWSFALLVPAAGSFPHGKRSWRALYSNLQTGFTLLCCYLVGLAKRVLKAIANSSFTGHRFRLGLQKNAI